MTAYYNEIDPYAAQWLRNLIAAGMIAPGDVDERSITEVKADDIRHYTQCHFFAGIGVWSYALRRAGWTDDVAVWTGSCPCQPFSSAGNRKGFDDERHLWPVFANLISECRPAVVFGEQVASKDANAWIDAVHVDVEAMDYAFGCIPFPSAGVGAPHIRDRAYWVADSEGIRYERTGKFKEQKGRIGATYSEPACGLVNTNSTGCKSGFEGSAPMGYGKTAKSNGGLGRMEHADLPFDNQWSSVRKQSLCDIGCSEVSVTTADSVGSFWGNPDWLLCRDGYFRPVESGTFPLADGVTNRMGRLRAYGNAINAEAAKEFISAFMECQP